MSSQLKLDWVKHEGGQYVETNRIDPFGESILRISFDDSYTVESEVSTAMIDAIENQNSTSVFTLCTKGKGGIILGTGASNCNTDSSFDDWSSYDENNDGCLRFHTPPAFSHLYAQRMRGYPYAWICGKGGTQGKWTTQWEEFDPTSSDLGGGGASDGAKVQSYDFLSYDLDADTNLLKNAYIKIRNNFWGELFVNTLGDSFLQQLNLRSDCSINNVGEYFANVDNEILPTITGGTVDGSDWSNSPYPPLENQTTQMLSSNIYNYGGDLTIPKNDLLGQRIGLGFDVQFTSPDVYTLRGDFSSNNYESDYVNIKMDLFMVGNISMDLQPIVQSFTLPPDSVIGQTVNGTIDLKFSDFAGTASVYVFDRNDFDIDGNPNSSDNNLSSLLTVLSEIGFNYIDDASNYGEVNFENPSVYGTQIQVGLGETVSMPFTYTSQTLGQDSFTIYVVYNEIDNSVGAEMQTLFADLQDNEKWYEAKTCNIDSGYGVDIELDYYPPDSGEDYQPNESGVYIENPVDVMFHLSEQELGYDKPINANKIQEARENHFDWQLGFSVHDEIEGKKLLQEISKSSKSIPMFSNDRLSFFNINNTYDGTEEIETIKEKDILSYSFSRNSIDDVKTRIDYKYKKDYGMSKYVEEYELLSDDIYPYYVTRSFGELDSFQYSYEDKINYYGLKFDKDTLLLNHDDTTEIIEDDFIRKLSTAEHSAEFMLGWNYNVHNQVTIQLPLKYYNLELGDLIEFDKMILDKKIYGENYVLKNKEDMPIRCGQYILPLFIIHDIKKDLKGVKIQATQLHHIGEDTLRWRDWTYSPVLSYLSIPVLGDLDGDGEVTVLDIILLVNILLEGNVQFSSQADFNQDGQVNILDIVGMINFILQD